jgi:hypothetical protein
MTAEEARNITKAALVNYALLAKIDKEIEKAARDGKYQVTYNFTDSYGYKKGISKEEYTTLCDRYEKVGFKVTRGLIREENPSLQLSWYDDPSFETNINNTETNID